MADPYLGEIKMFGGNFAPAGWAFCDGQILSIAQNTALFSLLGTTYGGNGVNTFALPDLRGRVPLHQGQGPGLSPILLGQVGGAETVTLTTSQIPSHSHLLTINNSNAGMTATATGNYINAKTESGESVASTGPNLTQLNPASVGNTGGSQPHENREPYLGISFIIALQGIYPSRN